MTSEQIEKRIKDLEAQLQQLIAEANRQIGMIQGRIDELKRIQQEELKPQS